MIDVIAKRRTTLNGNTYAKNERVSMPKQQFDDLEPTGRFERAPKAKPEAGETTATKSGEKAD